jgi:hypothetical protein
LRVFEACQNYAWWKAKACKVNAIIGIARAFKPPIYVPLNRICIVCLAVPV